MSFLTAEREEPHVRLMQDSRWKEEREQPTTNKSATSRPKNLYGRTYPKT